MWSHANNPLWVVTSYFNPCKYRKRFENFIKFRNALGAPLLVVELQEHGAFELSKQDADTVIQLQGEPAIWQKERLINVGIHCLPDHVNYVAWIDCDLIFENDQWVNDAIDRLDRGVDLVQLFSGAIYQKEAQQNGSADFSAFSPDYMNEVSGAKMLNDGRAPSELSGTRTTHDLDNSTQKKLSALGYAWAARVDRNKANQLYDANIIGGGDRVDIAAAFTSQADRDEVLQRILMSEAHFRHQRSWIHAQGLRSFDYIPGRVFHFWHGSFKNRNYLERKKILLRHNYDPMRDIKLSDNGAWQWTNPKSRLAQDVAKYFQNRQEDG